MSEQGETPTIQQIIDRSSHCTVEDCTGKVHSAVKAKISDLRLVERELAQMAKRVSELEAKLAEAGMDAERLAYLTADHDNAEIRNRRNHLLCRMPVMSRSAACADIDIGLAALAAERKESGNG